jgi:hypothetical protein
MLTVCCTVLPGAVWHTCVNLSDIDNWSAGFTIDNNVVVNTQHTTFGWIFFQYFASQANDNGAAAHDNTAHGNTVCNSGPPPQNRDPWDEITGGANVTRTINVTGDCSAIPASARAVVAAAGPRPAPSSP